MDYRLRCDVGGARCGLWWTVVWRCCMRLRKAQGKLGVGRSQQPAVPASSLHSDHSTHQPATLTAPRVERVGARAKERTLHRWNISAIAGKGRTSIVSTSWNNHLQRNYDGVQKIDNLVVVLSEIILRIHLLSASRSTAHCIKYISCCACAPEGVPDGLIAARSTVSFRNSISVSIDS
jgi:hypothetical protein